MVVMRAEIAKGAPLVAVSRLEKQAGIQPVADVMSAAAVTTGERPSRYCTVAFRFTTPSPWPSASRVVRLVLVKTPRSGRVVGGGAIPCSFAARSL
jgi:hypothetical protein